MKADSGVSTCWQKLTTYLGNLDGKLLMFLNENFPKEVKAKQKENERAAGMDQLDKVGMGKRGDSDCIIQ